MKYKLLLNIVASLLVVTKTATASGPEKGSPFELKGSINKSGNVKSSDGPSLSSSSSNLLEPSSPLSMTEGETTSGGGISTRINYLESKVASLTKDLEEAKAYIGALEQAYTNDRLRGLAYAAEMIKTSKTLFNLKVGSVEEGYDADYWREQSNIFAANVLAGLYYSSLPETLAEWNIILPKIPGFSDSRLSQLAKRMITQIERQREFIVRNAARQLPDTEPKETIQNGGIPAPLNYSYPPIIRRKALASTLFPIIAESPLPMVDLESKKNKDAFENKKKSINLDERALNELHTSNIKAVRRVIHARKQEEIMRLPTPAPGITPLPDNPEEEREFVPAQEGEGGWGSASSASSQSSSVTSSK